MFIDPEEEIISQRYLAGESLCAIGKSLDTSATTISRVLVRTGTPTRSRAETELNKPTGFVKTKPELMLEIREYFKENPVVKHASVNFGVSAGVVVKAIKGLDRQTKRRDPRTLIAPTGEVFYTNGIITFIKEHGLSKKMLYKNIGKAVPPMSSSTPRKTAEAYNTVGWVLDPTDHANSDTTPN
jgi:hypothetical protein